MHTDHVGGLLLEGGKAAFPNAVVRADKAESDYKLSPQNLARASAAQKGGFERAVAALAPYTSSGRFKPFEGDTELVPGVHSVAAHLSFPRIGHIRVDGKGYAWQPRNDTQLRTDK